MSITAKVAKKFETHLQITGEYTLSSIIRIGLSPVLTSTKRAPSTSYHAYTSPRLVNGKAYPGSNNHDQLEYAKVNRRKIADLPNRRFSFGGLLFGIIVWPIFIAFTAIALALSLIDLTLTSIAAAVTLPVTGVIDGIKALDKKVKAHAAAKKQKEIEPLFEHADPIVTAASATPSKQKPQSSSKNIFGKLACCFKGKKESKPGVEEETFMAKDDVYHVTSGASVESSLAGDPSMPHSDPLVDAAETSANPDRAPSM